MGYVVLLFIDDSTYVKSDCHLVVAVYFHLALRRVMGVRMNAISREQLNAGKKR